MSQVAADAGGKKFAYGYHHYLNDISTYLAATLDETAQDPATPGYMWAGSGIPADNFILRQYDHSDIELAIKAHLRKSADIPPTYVDDDGVIHVEVPSGHYTFDEDRPDLAKWNFTFSYNVGLDPSNPDLDAYSGWLLIDVDPTKRTDYLKLRLTRVTDTPDPGDSGFGWKLGNTVVIPDDEGTSQVTQNSQNLGFYDDAIDADPHTPGHQSYAAADFPPGEFDVIMLLQRKYGRKLATLHAVFNVVDPD